MMRPEPISMLERPAPPGPRWEYRAEAVPAAETRQMATLLRDAGLERWELVAVYPIGHAIQFWLKRPLP